MTPTGLVVVTDRRQARVPLPEVVAAAVEGGARWVLLREKDLPRAERAALASRLREILAPVSGRLVVAGPDPLGGDAVHLAATDPLPSPLALPPPAPTPLIMEYSYDTPGDTPTKVHDQPGWWGLVGRSCHTGEELGRVTVEDYVTLSPVYPSRSKPGYGPALGVAGLRDLCARTDLPVVALGGIETPERAAACFDAGAAAVAMMGAVMRADDPAAVVASLREGARV